ARPPGGGPLREAVGGARAARGGARARRGRCGGRTARARRGAPDGRQVAAGARVRPLPYPELRAARAAGRPRVSTGGSAARSACAIFHEGRTSRFGQRKGTETMSARPRVVIIGAGFGGLNAAKALRHAPVDVLLIDRNNYHTFQPLLYQVATAGLTDGDIAYQVRGVFHRQRNFRFRLGTVVDIDKEAKEVLLADGDRVAFDYLIAAPGAVYNDFGVP